MIAELDNLRPYLADRVPSLMAEHGIPGLAIAVVHGPDSWLAGFGRTRRTSGSPVEEIFTTLAALAAVRDGLVDLDDPVSQHLPEFTVQFRFEDRPQDTMTLRQVLCDAADFTHEAPVGGNFEVGPESFEDHVRSISDTWLCYPVGARHEYSNLGVDLAAHIIARARDTDFPACMRDSVLNPLGMTSSTYDLAAIEATANRAIGHDPDVPELPVKVPMLGAGGMYSCIADLAKFLKAELADQVLPPQLATQMKRCSSPSLDRSPATALAWANGPAMPGPYTAAAAAGFGFLADLYWEPATGSGVAILTNSSGHPLVWAFALQILARLAGRDPDRPSRQPGGRPATAEEYGRFRGQYAGRGSVFELLTRDGLIGLTAGAKSFIALTALESGDLLADVPGVPMPLQLPASACGPGRRRGAAVRRSPLRCGDGAVGSPPLGRYRRGHC